MVRASPIKTSFNAGEWSPLLYGHVNLEKWNDSARLIQNMICLKQGPITRRGGTRFVKEVKNSADDTVIIPFEFNIDQEYIIELGDQYYRFYTDNAPVVESPQNITAATSANPVEITIAGHGYSNGDEVLISSVVGMTELNGKYFLVAGATTDTFTLQDIDGNAINGSAYTAYTSGGTASRVYEIASNFTTADLKNTNGTLKFQISQSADVIYIVHEDFPVQSLSRTSNTSWALNNITFADGPYLPINDTATTLAVNSSGDITASSVVGINEGQGFLSTDVGRVYRIFNGSVWEWATITAVISTTTAESDYSGVNIGATVEWRLGLYSETTGYPSVITFFQDRVFLGGSRSYPDRFCLSRTGGYSDAEFFFSPSDADGTVTDDGSIVGTLQSGKVNAIRWAGADDKGLVIGTAAKEWILRPSSSNEVLTPTNSKADSFSSVGSAYVQPFQAENGIVFIQRARRKLHDIIYSFERDQLKPRDLTITSEHITRTGICELAFQQEPINCVWMRRTDGLLVGYTYYPDESVFASHRHVIGGTDVKVQSIATVPSVDTSRVDLWMVVERTVNGATRKYIEYMERYYEDDMDKEDAFHLDSGLTYDGSAVSTVRGLDHLEGETVKLLVDGNTHPDLTVTNGSITLNNAQTASVWQVGLSNTWAFRSQTIEAGSKDGTAQGKIKRISSFVLRVLNTLGLKYGSSPSNLDEHDFNQGAEYNETLPLFTGDIVDLPWPEGYETDGLIYLESDSPYPATILSIMPQVTTYDKG